MKKRLEKEVASCYKFIDNYKKAYDKGLITEYEFAEKYNYYMGALDFARYLLEDYDALTQ